MSEPIMEGSLDDGWEKIEIRKFCVEMAVKICASDASHDVIRTAKDLLTFVEQGEAPAPLKGVNQL